MIKLKCKSCDDDFEVAQYRENTAKYCSKSCSGREYQKEHLKNKGFKKGRIPWNKGKKGIHLNPNCEFKKGNVPWNKGKKGSHFSPETEFKKGRINENKLPVGSITIRQSKKRKEQPRSWIKIADPSVWELLAVHVWEKHNGKVPKGYVLHHKDKDSLNDEIDNLETLTRSEHIAKHRDDLYAEKDAGLFSDIQR